MISKVLVVGATGLLGGTTLRLLLDKGIAVRALVRDAERAPQFQKLGAEVAIGDMRDSASLRAACAGVSHVVATANAFMGKGSNKSISVDLYGNLALVDAARAAGVQRFVFVSGDVASADSLVDFFRYKQRVEDYLKESGLDYVIIRGAAFMDVWAETVGAKIATKGVATIFGDGTNPISFIARDDVADFIVRVIDDSSVTRETIALGGPEDLTMLQVAEKYERHAGRTAKRKHIPVAMMRTMRILLRPLNPVLARMMSAGVEIATVKQTIDPAPLRARFPGLRLQSLDEWLRTR